MGSTPIHGATVLSVDAENAMFNGGFVAIRDGRISGLGPKADTPNPSGFGEVLDLTGHLVMPGLVNADTHSVMVLFRGRSEGQSLVTKAGLHNPIREPQLWLVLSDIKSAVSLSCAEVALSGTTTFSDRYFFDEQIAHAWHDAGRSLGAPRHPKIAFVEEVDIANVDAFYARSATHTQNTEQRKQECTCL